ncbi:MAG: hypothetical protein ACTHOF_08280 [Flavisolibacter sp.]
MDNSDNIQDELRGLNSELPSVDKTPFSVPEGYFAGLAGSVMAKIKGAEAPASTEIASLSPLLAGISRNMPYVVPAGYFQTTIEELPFLTGDDPRSAILSLVERVTPYEAPLGYFANLPDQVLEKVSQQSKAKIIPVVKRRWMRMAVAAMVIGIMGLSGWFYFNQNKSLDADKPLAQQLKNVSTKELNDFIRTTDITTASTETAQAKTANKTEVEQMLTDVSDKELASFLNQVPSDDEDLLVIN